MGRITESKQNKILTRPYNTAGFQIKMRNISLRRRFLIPVLSSFRGKLPLYPLGLDISIMQKSNNSISVLLVVS